MLLSRTRLAALQGATGLLLALVACAPIGAQESSPFSRMVPQGRMSASIAAAEFSPDGKVLAVTAQSADEDGSTALLQVPDLKVLGELGAMPDQVHCLAFGGPDGGLLCAGGRKGRITIWDLRQGKLLTSFYPRWGTMNLRAAFLPDPRLLYVEGGSYTGTVIDWTRSRDREPSVFLSMKQNLPSPVWALSPAGKVMHVAHIDDTGLVVNRLSDGAQVAKTEGSGWLSSLRAIAWSADGSSFAVLQGMTVSVWDATTGKRRSTFNVSAGPASCAVFTPDLRWVAIARGSWVKEGETLAVWDVTGGRQAHTLATGCPRITGMALSNAGRHLFVYGYAGGALLGSVD